MRSRRLRLCQLAVTLGLTFSIAVVQVFGG